MRNQGAMPCTAAACGSEVLVRQLLERGCHPDASGPFEYSSATAIFWATRYGHEEIVKLLLEYGADLDCGHRWEPSVLINAILHESIFKLLLEHGTKPTIGGQVDNVLDISLKTGKNTSLVRMLLDSARAEQHPLPTTLHFEAQQCNEKTHSLLSGSHPYHISMRSCHHQMSDTPAMP